MSNKKIHPLTIMRFIDRYITQIRESGTQNRLVQVRAHKLSPVPVPRAGMRIRPALQYRTGTYLTRFFSIILLFAMFTLDNTAVAQSAKALTKEKQAAITPAKALAMLKEGNERFLAGDMMNRDLIKQVKQTAGGQYPYAVVLGCIDSRVPPELIFDQGIGDMFTPRIAGNFVNADILGSMEFATKVAGSKIIVVLGHTSCGAVKGACDNVEMGNLTHLLKNLMPAVHAVDDVIGERNSSNSKFVDDVAHTNVQMTVDNILERSPVMKELVDSGELMVVGAMHDVKTGRVTFMD